LDILTYGHLDIYQSAFAFCFPLGQEGVRHEEKIACAKELL
jgi:hypothetical protein